ncbi:MAG: DNA-directed RNA polymerase subunit RpoH/Rpb5 C-terminal domain-containing protein [Nanoarchaeota archaeon]
MLHILQPKQSRLSKEEEKSILEQYSISKSQLPKIKLHDATIRDTGVKKGDIVKISRKSASSESFYYRVVI